MGTSLHRLASAVAWDQRLSRASLTCSLSCKGPAGMIAWGLEEAKGPGAWLCTSVHGSLGAQSSGGGWGKAGGLGGVTLEITRVRRSLTCAVEHTCLQLH